MKTIYLYLSLLLTLFLVGCQLSSPKPSSNSKDTLTLSWREDFGDVNPHRYNPDQMVVQNMVYEGLVRYGDKGVIEPVLAESWEVNADGTVYTFHLRDATYSDGSPLTANNVKRNFDAIFSEGNKADHSWFPLTTKLASYQALDDKTFSLTLKEPYSATLYDLAMIRPIRFLADAGFPKGDNTKENNVQAPIGTGAWVVKEKKANEYITFKRNDQYWGEKPRLKEVTIKVIPDAQTRALAFESGELDLIYGNGLISLDTFAQYADDANYTTAVSQPMSSRLFLLNAAKPLFSDQKVRQAMNHAMNKQEIAETIFRGAEKPADTIFSSTTPFVNTELTPYDYDLKKAEGLLEEAGWIKGTDGIREKEGQKMTLHLPYIVTKAADKDIAEYLQGEWKKLGIDVQLEAMEQDAYWENAKTGNFDALFTFSWGAPWDPHAWMTALTSQSDKGQPENIAIESLAIKNELDELVQATLLETEEAAISQGYQKALTLLHEEALYIPLTYQSVVSVYRTGELAGLAFAPEENIFPVNTISKP